VLSSRLDATAAGSGLATLLGGEPDRAALVCGQETIAYAELDDRIARAAAGLAARGVGPGDPVALLLRNGPPFVIAFLATVRLGAVAVPLSPQLKPAEIEFSLRESGARAVVADRERARICRALDGLTLQVLSPGAIEQEPRGVHDPPAGDAAAVFSYSSGTTGRPKRVSRSHDQLRWEAEQVGAAMALDGDDAVFCAIALHHTYGLGCCMLASLARGATLVIAADAQPLALRHRELLGQLVRCGATVVPAVPYVLRILAESQVDADLSALRLCFSAANVLPRSTFDAFDSRFGVPIRQLYGSTETGTVTLNLDEDPWATAASIGRPLDGIDVAVLDADDQPIGDGRIGEIAVRSPAAMHGYAGVPEDIARQDFRDEWFLTGDRGRLDDQGRLFLTGRRKLLIDVSGDKVDPIEVEDVLAVHPKVREVVVVGVPGKVEGEDRIKAVVVADDGCQERELVRFCRERLANHKVPQLVEFRDEIPRSSAGRVLRKYLV
jgi:long-chain acyl-CoA synthetase